MLSRAQYPKFKIEYWYLIAGFWLLVPDLYKKQETSCQKQFQKESS